MKRNQNWEQLENTIIKHDYCSGCGVCAGVCPVQALQMRCNDTGEYRPRLIDKDTCTECGLCARVCPFFDGNPDENIISKNLFADTREIKYSTETGYYLNSFIGHVADDRHRMASASGGIVTWLLEKLLSEKAVDYALCVSPNDAPDNMFTYKVCKTIEDIRSCSS